MYFTKNIWKLILKFYLRKFLYLKNFNYFFHQSTTQVPILFLKKKRIRRRNKKKIIIKSLFKIKVHNGRKYYRVKIKDYKIPLLYYVSTIKYGKKKEKKKIIKKRKKK